MQIYDDDDPSKVKPDLEASFKEALELSTVLKSLGYDEAAEIARPFRLLDFEPMKLLSKLREHAETVNGHAALLVIDRDVRCHCVWSYSTDDEFTRLVSLKRKGCWIAGFLCFSPDGTVTCCPEKQPKDDAPVFSLLLNTWARLYAAAASQRVLDEFVQTHKNTTDWDESTLEQFDSLTTQYPEINKTLAVDSHDVNFPL